MEAIHIFIWTNGFEDVSAINMGGEGELYQDAINLLVVIELIDQVEQRLFCGVCR